MYVPGVKTESRWNQCVLLTLYSYQKAFLAGYFSVLELRVWLLGAVVVHHFCFCQDISICGNPVLKYLSCCIMFYQLTGILVTSLLNATTKA